MDPRTMLDKLSTSTVAAYHGRRSQAQFGNFMTSPDANHVVDGLILVPENQLIVRQFEDEQDQGILRVGERVLAGHENPLAPHSDRGFGGFPLAILAHG